MGFDRWFLHGCCLEVVVRLLQKLETFLFCSLVQILLFCLIYWALKLRIISIIEYFLLLQKQKNFSFPSVLQCKIFRCGKCTRSNLLENIHWTNLNFFHKHTSFINIIMGRYLKIHFGKAEMFHFNRRKTFNSKRGKMSYFNFNKISYNVWMKRKENTVWKHFDLSDGKYFYTVEMKNISTESLRFFVSFQIQNETELQNSDLPCHIFMFWTILVFSKSCKCLLYWH